RRDMARLCGLSRAVPDRARPLARTAIRRRIRRQHSDVQARHGTRTGGSSTTASARIARWGGAGALSLAATAALGLSSQSPAAAATGFTLASQANGLQLDLFGTELSGGNSSACVNDGGTSAAPDSNLNGDGTPSLCDQQAPTYAAAEGEGTLLSSSGEHIDQKATEATPGQSSGSTNPVCAQGGGTPGGTPFTISLGASCASADASVGSSGDPSSSATGSVAAVTVGLNGILSPILGAVPSTSGIGSCSAAGTAGTLLNTVCTALSTVTGSVPQPAGGLPTGIEQVLENLYSVVTKSADPTITVNFGQAKSSVSASSGTIDAIAQGSSLDVAILPGVGCAAPSSAGAEPTLAQCIADAAAPDPQYAAPLAELTLSPAETGSAFDGTNWVPTATGSVGTLHVNIPGDQQVIPLSPGSDQTILAGTPLQSSIDLGSVQTNKTSAGITSVAHGALIDLLENSAFPGASATKGAISVDLDATGTSGSSADSPATPPAPAAPSASTASPPPAVAVASASPTAVHTGEWWSGSSPLLAALGVLGVGLLAWPRLRRLSLFGKVKSTFRR
ncbi:MAG: hypothetical protein ACRDV4_02540, partial [Acidimicrobiales bacterium]